MKKTQYSLYTYNSPSIIRRLTHKYRFYRSTKILKMDYQNSILDYGAGDGYLSVKLKNLNYKDITTFEPVYEQYRQLQNMLGDFPEVNITDDIQKILTKQFDFIFCLEVLEHLPDIQLNEALNNIGHLLKREGKILISVPCESGFNGFFKNMIKKIVDKNKSYSYRDLWDIAFNKKMIDREISFSETNPYIFEHFGFNNLFFEKKLREFNLDIESKIYFPVSSIRLFSSQIFYVVIKN